MQSFSTRRELCLARNPCPKKHSHKLNSCFVFSNISPSHHKASLPCHFETTLGLGAINLGVRRHQRTRVTIWTGGVNCCVLTPVFFHSLSSFYMIVLTTKNLQDVRFQQVTLHPKTATHNTHIGWNRSFLPMEVYSQNVPLPHSVSQNSCCGRQG